MSFTMADAVVEVTSKGGKEIPQDVARDVKSGTGSVMEAGSGIGKALVGGIGAAIVGAGLKDMILSGLDMGTDKALLVAQLGLSPAEAAENGRLAGELYGQNYGDSLGGVNDAIAAVRTSIGGMRDANSDAVGDMTGKLLNLQTTFGVDVSQGAQLAGQMITTGLATDGTQAVDLLTTALQKVPSALRGDLLDAIDEYGPSFSALGIGGEEAFGLLVGASAKGMYGIDKTGDALKEFTIRATDMSTSTGAVYDKLGLNQQEYSNMLLAGGDQASDAFNTIVLGLQRINDPAERSSAALALFGTPLEDLSVNDIPKFLSSLQSGSDVMGGFEGSADAMGATLADTAASKVETMRRSLELMGQDLVNAEGPLGDLSAAAAVMGPDALTAAGGAAMLGSSFISAMTGIGPLLAAMKTWKVVTLLGAAAQSVATAAQWAFNVAAAANPIGLIIIAIVALIAIIVLLVMNWDTVVKFMTDVWNGFVSWFMGVMDGFLGWWNGIWTAIVTWVQTTFGPLVQWAVDLFNNWLLGWQIIGAAIGEWWSALWQGITDWFNAVFGPLVEIGVKMFELWGLAWQVIGKIISDWWNGLWQGISDWFNATFGPLIQWGIETWTSLQATFAVIGAILSDSWATLWNNIANWFRSTFGPVISWGMDVWNSMTSFFRSVGDALGSWWSGLWSGITSGFQSAVGAIGGLVNNVVGFFTGLRDQVTGALAGAADWLWNVGVDLINGLVGGIQDTVGNVAAAITEGLDSAIAGAKAFLGIASPSKLMAKVIGRWILPGVEKGVDKSVPEFRRSLSAAVDPAGVLGEVTPITAAPSYGSPVTSITNHYSYDVTIDAKNVRDFSNVVDIFDSIGQAGRTGKAA